MDWVSMWPAILAAVAGSAGLAGAWWYSRGRMQAAARASARDANRAGKPAGGKRRGTVPVEELDTVADWAPAPTRLLNSAERQAYQVLRKALPEHMILAQVPVARFVKVPTQHSYSEWLRRVGSLCADFVVCDMSSQVIAVVEIRQTISRDNERAQRRHARMDKVLRAAEIPVHVWLEGALPGAAVARESVLGAAIPGLRVPAHQEETVRRNAEAAAVVAAMQTSPGIAPSSMMSTASGLISTEGLDSTGGMRALSGVSVDETPVDFNLEDWPEESESAAAVERKEPAPSTWFDDLDTGEAEHAVAAAAGDHRG